MKFLPSVVYDRDDLKRQIDSLILDEQKQPKPVVKVPKWENPEAKKSKSQV